jgi:hypothetical protein
MNRSMTMIVVLGMLMVAGCNKKDESGAEATAKIQESDDKADKTDKAGDPKPAASDAAAIAGVEAGGIQHDDKDGPAAVMSAVTGTVEIKRVGEATFAAAKADAQLYPGDQVRTVDRSTATVTLADETVIEVAEVSTIGIASRDGTADPASAAAVLAGLARFTVTSRAPGEGPFRVYTPSGMIVTRGTVYGVGVAASGEARVGVETGVVDVIGLANLAATPVIVEAGSAATLQASGSVDPAATWPADDWGDWRDRVDANVAIEAAVDAHGKAMADLDAQLAAAYADLDTSVDSVATFETSAAASADKGDSAAYLAVEPEGAAAIDASFAVGSRLEALTWAYAGHAALAADIYVRQPAKLEARWKVVAPRVDAAVLWPKRYEVTAAGYFEPLRGQYYVHHPVGRMHAELVGITVPDFYAKVELPAIEPARVRARVKVPVWIAPEMTYKAQVRPVWVATPSVDWSANVKVAPAPMRANVGWYVRPPTLKAKVLLGGDVTGNYVTRFKVATPEPRATIATHWKVPVGLKVRIGAPDLAAAASARARIKLDAGGRIDVRGMADPRADMRGKVDVKAPDVKGKVDVNIRDHRDVVIKTRDHRDAAVKAGTGAKVHAGAAVKAGADVHVKVKVPEVKVKVKVPEVKVKGKASGGFKIGG